jgi:hypothetical protein
LLGRCQQQFDVRRIAGGDAFGNGTALLLQQLGLDAPFRDGGQFAAPVEPGLEQQAPGFVQGVAEGVAGLVQHGGADFGIARRLARQADGALYADLLFLEAPVGGDLAALWLPIRRLNSCGPCELVALRFADADTGLRGQDGGVAAQGLLNHGGGRQVGIVGRGGGQRPGQAKQQDAFHAKSPDASTG